MLDAPGTAASFLLGLTEGAEKQVESQELGVGGKGRSSGEPSALAMGLFLTWDWKVTGLG